MQSIRNLFSTVNTTAANQVVGVNALKTGPIELTLAVLAQVGGGLATHGTVAANSVSAPKGTW